MEIAVNIDDDYVEALQAEHGDLAIWLKTLAESHFVNANRTDAMAAIRQGLLQKPAFAKAVANEARKDPDFKSRRPNAKPAQEREVATPAQPEVPAAFATFDHDGDGKPGGSLPRKSQ